MRSAHDDKDPMGQCSDSESVATGLQSNFPDAAFTVCWGL